MQDLALLVTIILLMVLAIGFCFGSLIATKTRSFFTLERLFLSVIWSSPIFFLSLWNQVIMVWVLIGYVSGTIIFWRKW